VERPGEKISIFAIFSSFTQNLFFFIMPHKRRKEKKKANIYTLRMVGDEEGMKGGWTN